MDQNNNFEQTQSNTNRIQLLLSKKWLIILGICIVLFIFLIILVITGNVNKKVTKTTINKTTPNTVQITDTPVTTPGSSISVDLQKAIDEAKQSAGEYDELRENTRSQYPWIKKLPWGTEKYFVYFDINNKLFIAKLYPAAADDIESIKADVKRLLKDDMQIPIEKYQFEWNIYHQ